MYFTKSNVGWLRLFGNRRRDVVLGKYWAVLELGQHWSRFSMSPMMSLHAFIKEPQNYDFICWKAVFVDWYLHVFQNIYCVFSHWCLKFYVTNCNISGRILVFVTNKYGGKLSSIPQKREKEKERIYFWAGTNLVSRSERFVFAHCVWFPAFAAKSLPLSLYFSAFLTSPTHPYYCYDYYYYSFFLFKELGQH